uniref:Uncharacterized protein n=1 Tax=Strongyloides papillosus TaxID=174720 RepID=A0A0N5BU18_STREA
MPTKQNQGSFTGHPMANNMAPPMPSFGTVIRQGLENGNIVGVEHRVRWLFQKGDEGKVNMMQNNSFKKNPKNAGN